MRRTASEVLRDLEMRVNRLEKKASDFDHLKSPQTGKIYDHLRERAPRGGFRRLEKLYEEMNDRYDGNLEDLLETFLEHDDIPYTKDVMIGGVVKRSKDTVFFDIYVPVNNGGYSIHKAVLKNLGEYGVTIQERLERRASMGASFTVTSSKSEDLQGWDDEGLMDYTDEIVTGEEKATTKTLMRVLSEMTPPYDEWDEVSYDWKSRVVMPGRDIILEVNFLRNARERDYIINLGNSEY